MSTLASGIRKLIRHRSLYEMPQNYQLNTEEREAVAVTATILLIAVVAAGVTLIAQ